MTAFSVSTVIYFPEQYVELNLLEIINAGYDLLVFDNSPQSLESIRLKSQLSSYPNFHYLSESSNVGLSKAINAIIKVCLGKGFPATIFFDQDTIISERTLQYINHSYSLWQSVFHAFYALVTFSSKPSPCACALIDTNLTINSGSLLNVQLIHSLGGFNQDYFVDLVDYELCLRVLQQNYRIGLCLNCPDLDHESKQPDLRIKFLTKTLSLRRYPSRRIVSTAHAHFRLFKCYAFRSPLFFLIITRSFSQYMCFQLVARVIPLKYLIAYRSKV